MLYDKERHKSLNDKKWCEETARDCMTQIVQNTIEKFDENTYWNIDQPEEPPKKSIYFGAAGTFWGLEKVSSFLDLELPLNSSNLVDRIYENYIKQPDTGEVLPSFFLGESGVLLLKIKYNYDEESADRLYKIINANIENPTLETLWGAPGTMLAAFHAHKFDHDKRWGEVIQKNADFLISTLKKSNDKGQLIWEQDLYERLVYYVGAGHGYFGNMYPLLKCLNLLKLEDQKFILSNISKTTKKLAIEEDGLVNWPATLSQTKSKSPLVQWCHGAPGIINCLFDYPSNYDEEIEQLLLKAGELIWKAGPLTKGVGLCHGTDGNGIALLQLYKRSGDEIWLKRARKFAMHAIDEVKGNSTLFTGDIGLAVYLMSCITLDSNFPTLDSF